MPTNDQLPAPVPAKPQLPAKQPALRVECITCTGELSGPTARAYLRGNEPCPFCHTSLDDAPDPADEAAGAAAHDPTYYDLMRRLPAGYTVERDGLRWYPMRNGRVMLTSAAASVYYGTFADAVAYCQRDALVWAELSTPPLAALLARITSYREERGMAAVEAITAWAYDEINRARLNELRRHAGLPPDPSSADHDAATPDTPAPGMGTGTGSGQE